MLSDLVQEKKLNFIFLVETYFDCDQINEITSNLGYSECFVVPKEVVVEDYLFYQRNKVLCIYWILMIITLTSRCQFMVKILIE